MKTIGIIGGLGPMATVYYMELITQMVDAKTDQEHPRIFLQSIPDAPDRTAYILGKSKESPLPALIKAGRELAYMGADFISIPCVTAQYFYPQLCKTLDIPVLSLCGNIASDIAQKQIKKVGIMATSGTIQSKVLENEFLLNGVDVEIPTEEMQSKVMQIIYHQVKSGKKIDWDSFLRIVESLQRKGVEKIILGCTELSVLKKEVNDTDNIEVHNIMDNLCIDVLEVLAQKAILESGAPLKKEYWSII